MTAGSSRALRLDPLSLPLSFEARDARADGGLRHIEIAGDPVARPHRRRLRWHGCLSRRARAHRAGLTLGVSDDVPGPVCTPRSSLAYSTPAGTIGPHVPVSIDAIAGWSWRARLASAVHAAQQS